MQDSTLNAGAALLGGILGGALAGLYLDLRDRWIRPKLKLDFDPKGDRIETTWGGDHPFTGIVLRARLRNLGRRTSAQNCRVFLTALTRIQVSGSEDSGFRDSRQVSWAGWNFDARALPREVAFFVDFARVSKATSGWQFTFERTLPTDQTLTAHRGTYRFVLVAVADNAAPSYLEVDVAYDGDWHRLAAWLPKG